MDYTTSRAEYDDTVRRFMVGEYMFHVGSLYAYLGEC
jgi:hypothetical protein